MMEDIRFSKRPKLNDPYLIVAWPGMGEVAFKAAVYLVEKLKAQEFAWILPENFFYLTGSVVQKGILSAPQLPYSKFYYWKNPNTKRSLINKADYKMQHNDLVVFISNAQPDLSRAEDYCQKIIQVARLFKARTMVSFAAMPQPIDHTHQPAVSFAATSQGLVNSLRKQNLNLLSEGQISGMNGLFLGLAKQEGLEGFCLLGEVPLYTIQIENPRASLAVLEVFSRILNMPVDLSGLAEQAQLMENEISKLFDYLKIDSQTSGPIGEEEIDKIKKSLSQLTRLPLSIKNKIEELFSQARQDISRANELKVELDKWNIYKEYEDRFLDLFRKEDTRN